MTRLIHKVIIGMMTATVVLCAKEQILTIDKAIEFSLEHSPDIDISRFDFEGAQQRSKFQKGYYLPRLDLNAAAGKSGLDYQNQDTLNGNALLGNISASQLLYDFGKTSGKISAAEEEAKAYEAQMNQFISSKILQVKIRFYDVLKIKSIIVVNQKNIELQEGQLKRAKRYYESGIKTIIDVTDAEVGLTQAKLELNNSEYELKSRIALLEQAMGYTPYNGHYSLSENKLDLPYVSKRLPRVNTSIPQLEGFAYEHRYELQSSRYLAQSAKHIIESEQGGYLPTLALAGDYQAQDVENDFATLTPEKQWQAGVTLNWNLYSGNQTDASVQEAKISSLQAASRIEDVRIQIKQQVVDASLFVLRTKDAVILSESIAKASEQKFIQAKKRYENDLSDYIELQEARQGYISALGDLVTSYYNYYIAIARLDFAIGR